MAWVIVLVAILVVAPALDSAWNGFDDDDDDDVPVNSKPNKNNKKKDPQNDKK